jgi:hypothetical protein
VAAAGAAAAAAAAAGTGHPSTRSSITKCSSTVELSPTPHAPLIFFRLRSDGFFRLCPDGFRYRLFKWTAAAYACLFAGDDDAPLNLQAVQKQERVARLVELAALNASGGGDAWGRRGEAGGFAGTVSRRLDELRAELQAGLVDIPPAITHGQLEKWAQGQGPKLW